MAKNNNALLIACPFIPTRHTTGPHGVPMANLLEYDDKYRSTGEPRYLFRAYNTRVDFIVNSLPAQIRMLFTVRETVAWTTIECKLLVSYFGRNAASHFTPGVNAHDWLARMRNEPDLMAALIKDTGFDMFLPKDFYDSPEETERKHLAQFGVALPSQTVPATATSKL